MNENFGWMSISEKESDTPLSLSKVTDISYFRAQMSKREMGWIENTSSSRTEIEHENAREMRILLRFLCSLAVKTSKKAFL